MAEAAVGFLFQIIGSILKEEAALLGAVGREISELQLELESTRSFLLEAEKHKDQNEGVKTRMEQVRDATLKAEDIIEEFMYHIDSLKRLRGSFKGFLCRIIHLPKELSVKHRTSIKLQKINAEFKAIAERSKRYSFGGIEGNPSTSSTPSGAQNIGESSFFIKDDDVVGIDEKKDKLIEWLLHGEMHRTVISVWGMGGSGKTTLVAKAYKDHNVKRHFNCSAWVPVSQRYEITDLFRTMIKALFNREKALVPPSLSSMGYIELGKILVDFLQQKRYVVVLDDVWNYNFWDEINAVLPDGRHGSRIIITTRMEDIANYPYGVGRHVLHFEPLTDSDAWTLFCKKAFDNNPKAQCPPELEHLALALVEKCGGLPLAIVAMARLMATKENSELKWKEIHDSLDWHLSNNPMLEVVKTVLYLSFNDLPYYLKHCYLYFCLFPDDRWIAGSKLIKLWMAQGFVEERRGLTPEEVGKSYLRQLMSRSLIQAEKKNHFFFRPKLFKLHDLMRELALSISKQENFCFVHDQSGMKEEGRARHHSIQMVDEMLQSCKDMSQVRSFLAFNFNKSSIFSVDTLLCRFRLIKVLDLNSAPIDNLPTSLGKLFNLRYLSLRRTRIKVIPKSFRKLRNLQTLDLKKTEVKALPHAIVKLHNLRHLNTCGAPKNEQFAQVIGIQVPKDVWKLKNLQVINCIEANPDVVKGIGKMTQIKKLYLTKVREEDELALCASIEKLTLLNRLLVMVTDEEKTLRMDALSSPPPLLRKLALIGRLKNVPPWFRSLHKLVGLHLHWSRLTEDPIPHISALPSLKYLTLVNAYDIGNMQLRFNEGFPELQQLSIVLSPELIEIIIAKGVMPGLTRLNLHICAKLKAVPQGIEHLTNLEELNLKEVSEELIKSIQGEESTDGPRVKHIPEINHYYKKPSGLQYESLSQILSRGTMFEHEID